MMEGRGALHHGQPQIRNAIRDETQTAIQSEMAAVTATKQLGHEVQTRPIRHASLL